jgi:hypothetical protein
MIPLLIAIAMALGIWGGAGSLTGCPNEAFDVLIFILSRIMYFFFASHTLHLSFTVFRLLCYMWRVAHWIDVPAQKLLW